MSSLSVGRLSSQCGVFNISQPHSPPRPGTVMALLYFYCMLIQRYYSVHLIINLLCLTANSNQVWKEAAVVLVFERDNNVVMSNYRSISILSIFSKLPEFRFHIHLLYYVQLNQSNMISSNLNIQLLIL
jgi:hypothetical protein